ncbi:MAG: MarR family transcriptional regulator [Pseudomonadota bacterium]
MTDALAGKVPKRHMRRMGQKAHGIDGGFESQKALEETYSERERRVLRLWLRLVRTSRRIEADVGAQMYKTFGVRFVRFDVLSQLYRAPDYSLSIGDLGASLLAPSGNISSLLDRMEADGLVKRIADPYDRRRYIIRLTQKGIDTFAEMAKANAHWVAGAFSAIDDETLDRLHDELASIAES